MSSGASTENWSIVNNGDGTATMHFFDNKLKGFNAITGTDDEIETLRDNYVACGYPYETDQKSTGSSRHALTKKDMYLALVHTKLTALEEIIKNKNNDYTGGSDDPFANFKATANLGLSDAKTGVLIRLVDKIQRIKTYIHNGNLQVKGEGVEDACMDIMGYSLLLLGMLAEDNGEL